MGLPSVLRTRLKRRTPAEQLREVSEPGSEVGWRDGLKTPRVQLRQHSGHTHTTPGSSFA